MNVVNAMHAGWRRALFGLALLALLSGCAVQDGLYQWGGYDALLVKTVRHPGRANEHRHDLEQHILYLEQGRHKVAPGLFAELGTMLLQAGQHAKARHYFEKERAAWPESALLMDALIRASSAPARPEVKS